MKKYLLAFLMMPFISYSGNYAPSRSENPTYTFESVPFREEEFTSLQDEILAYVEEMDQQQTEDLVEKSYTAPARTQAQTFRRGTNRPRITHRKPAKETIKEEIVAEEEPQQNPVVQKRVGGRQKQRNRIVRKSVEQEHRSLPEKTPEQKTFSKQPASAEVVQQDQKQEVSSPKRIIKKHSSKNRPVVKQKRQVVGESAVDQAQEPSEKTIRKTRVQRRITRGESAS